MEFIFKLGAEGEMFFNIIDRSIWQEFPFPLMSRLSNFNSAANYWLVPLWAVRVAQSYMIHCNTCKSVYIKVLEKWEVTTRYRLDKFSWYWWVSEKKWHIYVIITSWNSHIFGNYSQKLNNWPTETNIVQTLLK